MFNGIEYDPDDPPPVSTWTDGCWHAANRTAENLLRLIRAFGWL